MPPYMPPRQQPRPLPPYLPAYYLPPVFTPPAYMKNQAPPANSDWDTVPLRLPTPPLFDESGPSFSDDALAMGHSLLRDQPLSPTARFAQDDMDFDVMDFPPLSPERPDSPMMMDQDMAPSLVDPGIPLPQAHPPHPPGLFEQTNGVDRRNTHFTPEATNILIGIVDNLKPYRQDHFDAWEQVLLCAKELCDEFQGCVASTLRDKMNQILRHLPTDKEALVVDLHQYATEKVRFQCALLLQSIFEEKVRSDGRLKPHNQTRLTKRKRVYDTDNAKENYSEAFSLCHPPSSPQKKRVRTL